MTNTAATTTLATDALESEGIWAYFPHADLDGDHEMVNFADILAAHLAAHPEQWTPAGDNISWTADVDTAALMAAANAAASL